MRSDAGDDIFQPSERIDPADTKLRGFAAPLPSCHLGRCQKISSKVADGWHTVTATAWDAAGNSQIEIDLGP
jgi:hypothetical protein